MLPQAATPSSETAPNQLGSLVRENDGAFLEKGTEHLCFNVDSKGLVSCSLRPRWLRAQQPRPAGQGHAVELAQLHLDVPVVAEGSGQTQ